MRNSSFRKLVVLPIVVGIVFFTGCAKQEGVRGVNSTESAGVISSSVAISLDLLDFEPAFGRPYSGQEVFAYIDEYPVTLEELDRFLQVIGPIDMQSHGIESGKVDPFTALKAFKRYFALVKEGNRQGIDNEIPFVNSMKLYVLAQIGAREYKNFANTVVVPVEDIREQLPEKWKQVNFGLKVFPTKKAAMEAKGKIDNGASFSELGTTADKGSKLEEPAVYETGFVFMKSGFFDKFDEPYLFGLEIGDVSDPVVSGVGTVIAQVIDIKDFSDEQKNEHLKKIRDRLTALRVSNYEQEALESIQFKVDTKLLVRLFEEEIDTGRIRKGSANIAKINGINLTYRDFRRMVPIPQSYIVKEVPREVWSSQLGRYMRDFLLKVAIANLTIAENSGFYEIEPSLRKSVHDFKWVNLYTETESRFVLEQAGEVSEKDLLARYEQDIEQFELPETVVFDYYFTPKNTDIQILWDSYEAGIPFEKVGEKIFVAGGMHGGKTSLKMKEGRVPRIENLTALGEAALSLNEGEVRVLDASMGYYFCRIKEKLPVRTKPFDEVRDDIEKVIVQERGGSKAARIIKELEAKLSVKLVEEVREPQMQKAPAFQELG